MASMWNFFWGVMGGARCVCNVIPRQSRTFAAAAEVAHEEEDEAEEDEGPEIEVPSSEARHIITEDSFGGDLTQRLRRHFVDRFKDPKKTTADRFVWDYWFVADQYRLLRTPASEFFPERMYKQLEEALCEYGAKNLGTRSISPIWLSYYVDGMYQSWHCDNPHGPFAFVLSLTDWENRPFLGGETMIMKPETLDFWRAYDPTKGVEVPQLIDLVEPKMGQLTVFNPRYMAALLFICHGTGWYLITLSCAGSCRSTCPYFYT